MEESVYLLGPVYGESEIIGEVPAIKLINDSGRMDYCTKRLHVLEP